MDLSRFARLLAGTLTSLAALTAAASSQAQERILRFVPYTGLSVIDPVWSAVYVSRNHGYLIYDTLFAFDSEWRPQPQMVDSHEVSADGLEHVFRLRDGLKWHDGQPVRAQDCVASLERWQKRDVFGTLLARATQSMTAPDDRTIVIRLKQAFPLLLHALAKISGTPPFMMPERVAKTEATKQIEDATGSGPYKFVRSEWEAGSKAVYLRNADYVPRREPPSNAAGGKIAKFDRIEWVTLPDANTAAQALERGEVDWVEAPGADLLPLLEKAKDVVVRRVDDLGVQMQIRPNHLAPPFDNQKIRQALELTLDQTAFMTAVAGDRRYWRVCQSFFACGTPYESTAGAGEIGLRPNLARARELLREAGYKGEKVIVLDGVDLPPVHATAAIVAQDLRAIGMNVEVQSMNFSNVIQRVVNRENAEQARWSLFITYTLVADTLSPATNLFLRAGGTADGSAGWPTDPTIQTLRADFLAADTDAARKEITTKLNARAWEQGVYMPVGQFVQPTAMRSNLTGVVKAPIPFFWNIERK